MLLSRKLCFHYSEKEAGRQKGDCGPDAGKYRLLPSGIPYKGNKGKSPYPSSSVLWLGFGISAYHRNAQKGFWINGYKKKIYSKKPLFQKRQRLKSNAADRNRTGTGITTHGILSPGRLPVPPLRHILFYTYLLLKTEHIRASTVVLSRYVNGRRWIRTTEGSASRFTVCPLWPLGNSPI